MRANLADRGCRHLMLLTHHGAALPLLFDAGLLHEGQARHPRHHMYVISRLRASHGTSPPPMPPVKRTTCLAPPFCVPVLHLLS